MYWFYKDVCFIRFYFIYLYTFCFCAHDNYNALIWFLTLVLVLRESKSSWCIEEVHLVSVSSPDHIMFIL